MGNRFTRRELKLSKKIIDEFSKAFEELKGDDPKELLKIDPTKVGKIATRLFFIDYFTKNKKMINVLKALKSSAERLEEIRKEEVNVLEILKREGLLEKNIDIKDVQAVEIENGKIVAITKDNKRIELGDYKKIIGGLEKKIKELKPAGPEKISKLYVKARKKELKNIINMLKKLEKREGEERKILDNMRGYLKAFAEVFSHLERFDEDLFILNTALLAYYAAALLRFLDFLEEIGKKDDFLNDEKSRKYLEEILHNLKEQRFEEKIQRKMAIVEKEERGIMFMRRTALSKNARKSCEKVAELLEKYLKGEEI